ncbi:MAG: glycosyltransferase family 39 protein [Hyphomicrobiales bacterium]|nr:glycosyltransferase family 39 protein [Hyphomicrobiales bacterium]MBV9426767.1 glycosyltransferase family 39 protein [Bradyrhizobiaceae bacterium]
MSANSSKYWSVDRAADLAAVAVLASVAVVAALTFRDYGLGWDDYTHAEYGDLLLSLYGSGFRDTRALSFVNLYMYGGGFDMLAALLAKILPFDLFETRRLAGAAIGLVGLFIVWRIGRRLGGSKAGLIALALLCISPLYYGHMYMNPKDAPFAVAMALLLLGLVRAFEEYPRPAPPTLAIFAIGLGLSIGTRVIGGISAFYAAAALVLIYGIEMRRLGARAASTRLGTFVVVLLPGLVLAYAVMGLAWPWSVTAPLNPLRASEYFSHFFEKPWKEMFEGVAILVPDMPRMYVPTLFALKEPEIVLLLGVGGMAGALVAALRRDLPSPRRAVLLLIAVASALPVAFTVISRPAMYNGIRHFVFIMPPVAVLGGLAGAWLFERLARYGRPALAAGAIAATAALVSPIVEMVRLHPYQYTHFNHLAGGIQAADEHFMLDYWGLAFKQAADELHAKLTLALESPAPGRRWRIAVCGPHNPAKVELGPEFVTTYETKGADFALMLGEFYCAEYKAPIMVEIKREGVVYARVYDIRGRTVSGLFVK